MKFALIALITTCLSTAACAGPPVNEAPAPVPTSCDAAGLQGLIGLSRNLAELFARERPARILEHDSIITMEFRPNRLNIVMGPNGQIATIRCG